jgi:hypothetical protein
MFLRAKVRASACEYSTGLAGTNNGVLHKQSPASQWALSIVRLFVVTTDAKYVKVSCVKLTLADYLEAVPPSTGKSMPVMKLLSSEARNTAADASSSAVPSRPIGIIFRK